MATLDALIFSVQIPTMLASGQGNDFQRGILPVLGGTLALVTALAVYYYRTHRHRAVTTTRGWLNRCLYGLFLLVIFVLSVTSFGSILQLGVMQHYALMAHTAAAGAFVFLLLPVAFSYLPRTLRGQDSWWLESLFAWLLVLSSMIVASTMLISMLPAVNTNQLLLLTDVHRYAGLTTAVSAILHLFTLIGRHSGVR